MAQLELHEAHLSAEELAQLLQLPALRKLSFVAGYSQEWTGEVYFFPSVNQQHLEVLAQHGQHLEILEFHLQQLEEPALESIRGALPNTQIVCA